MLWFFYNILFALGILVMLPRAIVRMRRRGGYARNFGQRFARYSPELLARLGEGGRIWVHAVSVGEIFVAARFMQEYRARRPDVKFVLSTTTSTGYGIAEKEVAAPDVLIYLPLDYPLIMKRALSIIRPKALVLVECELWPNLIRLAKRGGIPVILINGRISDHSYSGYSKLRVFTRPLLAQVDLLCVQSEDDRQKLDSLGADPARLHVVGSAKYDMTPSNGDGEEKARAALEAAGIARDRLVLLGGSTWAGEEEVLLDAYKELRATINSLVLVLVPRHAERREKVLSSIADRGLSVVRRTEFKPGASAPPDVLLVDTTGELRGFYACADVIFVGKSLTEHGGQNIIEPARCGRAIVVGPNMENFAAVTRDFLAAGALIQVRDPSGLRDALRMLLADPGKRAALGENAQRLVREKAGAVRKTLDLIFPIVGQGAGI
jgi:3-deoxy-D-manno-octulosonic-acid transferase